MPDTLKPVLLFALQTTVSSPIYDKQGRMLGRTFSLPGSNKQYFALPDCPKAREHAVDSIMAHMNPATPPRQVLKGMDDEGKFYDMDLSLFYFAPKIKAAPPEQTGVVFATREEFEQTARDYVKGDEQSESNKSSDFPSTAVIAANVHALLSENGKMTPRQLAALLDIPEANIKQAIAAKKAKFKVDDRGFYTAKKAA
jgi:hypothetical protein